MIDPDARPVAFVGVGPRAPDGTLAAQPSVKTAADGSFELPIESGAPRLAVSDERWTTILEGVPVDSASGQESLVLVAPRIELQGAVVDEFGLPVAGAAVRLDPQEDLRSRLSAVLDFSANVDWLVTTDEGGSFRFAGAPGLKDARLSVRKDGFQPLQEPAPEYSRADLVLVLSRPALASNVLSGVVLDSANSPVEGALVSMGIDTARSDEHGLFSFRLDDPDSHNRQFAEFIEVRAEELWAVKPGYLPGTLRARGRDEDGRAIWPDRVVLKLGTEPLSIQGVVVDARGAPQADVQVWLADPTFFGGLRGKSSSFPRLTHMENVLAGAEPGWHSVRTDERGRFELAGLLERDYVVVAMDPETLLRVERERVRAGERDLSIVLPDGASYSELRGRVVDSRGLPVENALVTPSCDAFRTFVQEEQMMTHHASAAAGRTDREGHFELRSVPRESVYLLVNGPDLIPLEWGREVEGGLQRLIGDRTGDLVIQVARRCHFQVELSVPGEADELSMLDGAGNPLVIREFRGNSSRDTERHPLVNGRSSTLAVSDLAATLVLRRAGSEVRRMPIRLEPGEPTILRP